MEYDELFELVKPYLKKNDFGVAHTKRVLDIAIKYFQIPKELEKLVYASIILHDIGGSSVKEQYEKGPEIATKLLKQVGYDDHTIKEVCEIIRTHHEKLENPSEAFKILYDSDQLVKFSEEEIEHYNSQQNFNWNNIIENLYYEHSKRLAIEMWKEAVDQKW